jgi:hypothetical protein
MNTIFIVDPAELNQSFIDGLKKLFKGKKIEISVKPIDETEYLLSSEANRKELYKSIQEINEGKTVAFSVEDFTAKYEKKLKDETGKV